LLTDGRMSGASGKVLAAIQVCPEAAEGGAIGAIRDGDIVRIDAPAGTLAVETAGFALRQPASRERVAPAGMGRELFGGFRERVTNAEQGASAILPA